MSKDEDLNLLPCAGCKQAKVLKRGDYCVTCALEWPSGPDYIVVTPKTLEQAYVKSGISGDYLRAKSDKAFESFQSYVIYRVGDEWQEILIGDGFHVPTVISNLLKGATPIIEKDKP